MTNDIHIIDPCSSKEWMRFIESHPDAGIFHHPAWMKMLRDIYRYRVFAVCLTQGNEIRAGIPFADVQSFITGKRWISLPFSDHCKPLLPENDPHAVDILMGYLKNKQMSETPKIEIRWDVESTLQTFHERDFVHHTLKLDKDEAALFTSFDKQRIQRSVKIADKEGVTVRECKTFDEFEVFYRLQVLTRRRLGVPAQPKNFFKGVWEYLLTQGLGFALIAFKDTTPLAGGVFFKFNNTVIYKYSASDMTYKLLQPNHAFLWKGIQRALTEGCTTFDFGRSEKNNEGLRGFKRGWSATEQELAYTVLADRPLKSGPSKLDTVIAPVIRHSPEFVCTLSGELLYRHFA